MSFSRSSVWLGLAGLGMAALARNVTADATSTAAFPDTMGAEFRTLAESYAADVEATEETRKTTLVRFTQRNLDDAEQLLKEKQKTGNITGIAYRSANTKFHGIAQGDFHLSGLTDRTDNPDFLEF